jgi:hypothetical protein
MRVTNHMPVDSECDPRIGVTEPCLCNGRRRAAGEKQASVSVTESVKAAARNLQRIENWNEMVPNDVLCDEEAATRIDEEKFLRGFQVNHKGRKLTSNSMSAVLRIVRGKTPMVLLPGDLDGVGLDNSLDNNSDVSAQVVFPHHGGGAGSSNLSSFATSFCRACRAESLIFSIGRGRYDTPRPEIVSAARAEIPHVRILCTQLSEHCASRLPATRPAHIGEGVSKGKEFRRCCAGTITLTLAEKKPSILPIFEVHRDFIAQSAPSALCMIGRTQTSTS